MSSINLDNVSWEFTSISVTCWVRQSRGPKAHNRESRRTDTLPFTAIWPWRQHKHCWQWEKNNLKGSLNNQLTWCSFSLWPIMSNDSPSKAKWAATSIGCVDLSGSNLGLFLKNTINIQLDGCSNLLCQIVLTYC
jgi:hypothetical protein